MIGRLWYYSVHIFFKILFTLFSSLKTKGRENINIDGGFIIAANHTSYLDPPLISSFSRKPVFFMAKKALFEVPVLSPVIKSLGAFPVARDGKDTAPVKHAISLLKQGKIVGIFPQGQRVRTEQEVQGAMGVTMIAKQAGVPVVPVGITGARGSLSMKNIFGKRKKLKIKIGKPIYYTKSEIPAHERENMRAFTDTLMNAIDELVEKNA